MKLNDKHEKALYWMYRALNFYPNSPDLQHTTVPAMLANLGFVVQDAHDKNATEARKALCESPNQILNYLTEKGVIDSDLCAGLDNISFLQLSPVQAVNKLRKARKCEYGE